MTYNRFNLNKFSLEFRNSKRVTIVGASGSGKTFFGAALTTKISNYAHVPVLVVDTKREQKFSRVKTLDQNFVNNIVQFSRQKRKIAEISLNNEVYRDFHVSEFAAAVCWTMKKSCLYIEEVVEHVGKNSVNFPQTNPLVYKLLQQGRERGCSLIVATQRVAQLNLSFVDEATDIFVFKINSREAKFIEDSFRLPKNSLDFTNKKEFSFYHVRSGFDPILYDPLPKLVLSEKYIEKSE